MNNELNEELKKKLDSLEAKWQSEEMSKFIKEEEEYEEFLLKKRRLKIKMNDNIDVSMIIEDMKDRLKELRQETAELDQKIEVLKIAVRYKDGKITRDEMRNELKKIVYRHRD